MSGKIPHRSETRPAVIVQAVIDLFRGRSSAMGDFTLEANAATTTVAAPNCGPESRPLLLPRTSNAAAAVTSTYIPAATVTEGQFIVHHANNAQTDRTFGYALVG
jgi:hypothetical protein